MLPERNEYPRPQFAREDWMSLNGMWEFCYDDADDGQKRGLPSGKKALGMHINVPFTYEYEASGIGDAAQHPVVWYRRTVMLPRLSGGRRALLCFNGCDYDADVWVNGAHAAFHRGAFAPFFADVTDFLKNGENVIVVRCRDYPDPAAPRGKQSWTGERFGCWYMPNTGIWQSVWLEFCGEDCIARRSLIPDTRSCSFSGEIVTLYGRADEAELSVSYAGKCIKRVRFSLDGRRTPYTVRLTEGDSVDESHFWTPERPNLFYVDFTLYAHGKQADRVHTRFGMRRISLADGHVMLNDRPYYQRLILDQGYWKESGLTPPSAQALKEDIELAKAMGFNGARKHQKFEDPYFYYYAEELGFLTWCEMPSAYCYCAEEVAALTAQWQEIVAEAQNFTSVACYVPLNESWGVRKILSDERQQDFARALYRLTKAIDPTRPISTNDGWENSDETDIISIHDYAKFGDGFARKYTPEHYDTVYPVHRRLMQEGCAYRGQSVIFTEFGGIAMKKDEGGGNWGYNDAAKDEEEFLARYESLMRGVAACDFDGFCYTQLTDVQQEVNGLLDEDHKPKFDLEAIRALTEIR